MRNFKKVLSLVLCLAMMLSIMVVGAGAAFKDQSKIVNKEAVDMCVALNIINGYTDGSYKPEGNVTRAEMCKMICIALNGGKEPATATKAVPTYSDIDGHWAEGYIEYCNTKGIVAGVGGGKFNPNGNVTGSQAAKMLLIALGYNADVEKYVGASWELYVNVQANQDGLYTDLETMDPSAALSRDNAAQMIWNTLQAYVINKSSSIDRTDGSITDVYSKSDSVDLLDKMYKGEIAEGTLDSFTYDSNKGEWTYLVTDIKNVVIEDGQDYGYGSVKVKSSVNYTDLLGQNVKAVYDKSGKSPFDAYGIFANDSEVVLTGIIADLPDIGSDDKSFKVDGVKYTLDDKASTIEVRIFNDISNLDLDDVAAKNVVAYDAQAFTAIDKNGDGDIDYLMVVPYAVAKVSYVNVDKFKVTVKANPFEIEIPTDNTYEFEDVNAYDGLAKNDYVTIVAAANTADKTDAFTKVDLIAGKVTERDGADVLADGTWYTLDVSYTSKVDAGTTLTDAAVVNGFIFDADTSVSTDVSDYVVVVDKADNSNTMNGPQVKLLFSDGTKKIVDLIADKDLDTGDVEYKNITIGAIYTYDTNKDGEYALQPVSSDKNVTGFDYTAQGNISVTAVKDGKKAAYINGYAIADDSVIFVKYNSDSSFKVMTGATMKTMKAADFAVNRGYMLATDNDKTGMGTVDMAYVVFNNSDLKTADTAYAYITGLTNAQNDDEKNVYKMTLWTEEGSITKLTVNRSDFDTLKVGDIVEFSLNTDDEIDEAILVSGLDAKAITGWDGSSFKFDSADTRYEVSDDIVYLFVDTDKDAGVSEFASTDIQLADDAIGGGKVDNAYVLIDKDGEVELVVYDINNELA